MAIAQNELESRAPAPGLAERGCVLASVALFALEPLLPRNVELVLVAVTAAIALAAFLRRWPTAARLGIVVTACRSINIAPLPFPLPWPIPFLLGLLVLPLVASRAAWLRPAYPWLRRGTLDRVTWRLIATFIVAAAIALIGWFLLLRPDLSDSRSMIPPWAPLWLLPFGALGFSMINAVTEEGVYRGVVLDALDEAIGPGVVAVLLQAGAFGSQHIHGVPRGAVGVGLAAIYGLMMGIVRRTSRGMLAPWITHVFADLVIAGILVIGATR